MRILLAPPRTKEFPVLRKSWQMEEKWEQQNEIVLSVLNCSWVHERAKEHSEGCRQGLDQETPHKAQLKQEKYQVPRHLGVYDSI